MKIKLTERDEKLLKIFAVIAAVALPYLFLISPMNEKIAAQEALNAEAQMQVDAYNNAIATEAMKTEELAKSQEELSKKTPNTTAMINNYETHYVFMDLANRNNLTLKSLDISDPMLYEEVIAPVVVEDFTQYDYMPVPTSEIDLAALTSYEMSAPYVADVRIVVEGNVEDINRMVDSINHYSDYFVVNELSVTTPEEGKTQSTIGVTVYFTGPKPVATTEGAA